MAVSGEERLLSQVLGRSGGGDVGAMMLTLETRSREPMGLPDLGQKSIE
jgi:hypothetical protein